MATQQQKQQLHVITHALSLIDHQGLGLMMWGSCCVYLILGLRGHGAMMESTMQIDQGCFRRTSPDLQVDRQIPLRAKHFLSAVDQLHCIVMVALESYR